MKQLVAIFDIVENLLEISEAAVITESAETKDVLSLTLTTMNRRCLCIDAW